ncbi:class I SAM-dependent methyltransferase [Methylobacillus methanolivorans]|uniref:Class I SAM-dependent methyltransferase n=1 Tax=Methylobacillus methanolivorans TaxID=1848927 RepID=A0ABW8GIS7_9PROT
MNHSALTTSQPSIWLMQHSHYIKTGGKVLDVASGHGRNAIWLAQQGFKVTAVDRDAAALSTLKNQAPSVDTHLQDLEQGCWPYSQQQFDAIIVCRYLHRPLLPLLANSLAASGVLIYETFMEGHEQYGRPRNPDFLLKSNELLISYLPLFKVISYNEGVLEQEPSPAVIQRLVAVKTSNRLS